MSSPTLRNSVKGFVAVILVVAVFLLWPESAQKKFERAKQLAANWHLEKAKGVLEGVSRSSPDAEMLRFSADLLLRSGDFLKADSVYRRLKSTTALSLPDSVGFALARYFLGHITGARTIAAQIAKAADRTQNFALRSHALNLLGLISFHEARYAEALKHQEESLRAARLAHSVPREADALRQLGVLAWYRGQLDTALAKYYQPALGLYRACGDRIGEATTISNIGLLYAERARWDEELKHQLLAFEIRKRIGDLRGQADSYYFLSTSGYLSKSKTFAYAYRMKSLELSTRIGYAWGREVAARSLEDLWREQPVFSSRMGSFRDSVPQLTGEGTLYAVWHEARKAKFEGRWGEVPGRYSEVIRICDSLNYDAARKVALWESGVAFIGAGRYQEAERNLRRLRRESGGEKVVPVIDIELAEIYVRTHRTSEAKRLLTLLLENDASLYEKTAGRLGDPVNINKDLGQIFQRRFREHALLIAALGQEGASVENMFDVVERERKVPFWGELRWLGEGVGDSKLATLVRLVEELDERPEEFATIQQLMSEVGEIQQSGALEQKFVASIPQSLPKAGKASIDDVKDVLEKDEIVVEYFVGFNEVLVFVVARGRVDMMKLPVNVEVLRSVARTFREALFRGKYNPNDDIWRAPARLLHTMLLQPLFDRKLVHSGSHLIISPHLFLCEIPFQALLDEQQRPSLMNLTISYVPSASMFVKKRNEERKTIESMVALAPVESSLPFTRREISAIHETPTPWREVFEKSDATAEKLLTGLESSGIVHVASHARMNRRFPFYSHIQCADRRVELHEILKRPISASLVFLSSCETGEPIGAVSEELTSESVVSFPHALLIAGASNVIASLWLVHDEATSSLVSHFYDNVAKSIPTALHLSENLTLAQRQLIAELELSGKSHPFYWAPFLLVGDGR